MGKPTDSPLFRRKMTSRRYFSDILNSTPDTVEDVIVESDGQWHTDDNKFGSTEWKVAHAPRPEPAKAAPVPQLPQIKDGRVLNQRAIVVSSDDEDDEGRVKRELSPSYDPGASNNNTQHSTPGAGTQAARAVIDLTLSDDEDDPPAPVPQKRKSRDSPPTEPAWKKSRYGELVTSNGLITVPPTITSPDPASWRSIVPVTSANRGTVRIPAGPRHPAYQSGSGSYRNPPATKW